MLSVSDGWVVLSRINKLGKHVDISIVLWTVVLLPLKQGTTLLRQMNFHI